MTAYVMEIVMDILFVFAMAIATTTKMIVNSLYEFILLHI